MPDHEYPGVPRRVFLRAAADLLDRRAHRLRQLADSHRRERRGVGAKLARDAKAGQREVMAAHLDDQSKRLWAMAESHGGPDIDAAVVGYVLAWVAGHDLAMAEAMEELADLGVSVDRHRQVAPNIPDYVDWIRRMLAALSRL